MLGNSPTVDQLGSDNISHGISHEDGGCHDRFLGGASHVASAKGNNQANYWSKEASERISHHRRDRVISPLRLPNHRTPCYHRKTAGNQHRDPGIGNTGGDVST